MASSLNFPIDAGTYFSTIITVNNDDGSLFNFAGMTLVASMKRSYFTMHSIPLHAEIYGAANDGKVRLWANPTDTMDIKPSRYVYDILATDPLDETRNFRVIEGTITINPRVS